MTPRVRGRHEIIPRIHKVTKERRKVKEGRKEGRKEGGGRKKVNGNKGKEVTKEKKERSKGERK